MSSYKHSFHYLDFLRGVAALVIAVRHAPYLWSNGYPEGVFFTSYLAVDFFFVLSGFVISHAYEARLRNGWRYAEFMKVRLIRLYPLFAMGSVLGSAGGLSLFLRGDTSGFEFVAEFVSALLILPTPYGTNIFPFNYPAWSLFFEIAVNSVFAAAAKILSNTVLAIIVFIGAAALIIAVALSLFGFGNESGALNSGMTATTFGAGIVRVCYPFFAGVGVYRLWKNGVRIRCHRTILTAALVIILAAPIPHEYSKLFDLLASIAAFPLIVMASANTGQEKSSGIYSLLGDLSYPLYVLQASMYTWIGIVLRFAARTFGRDSLSPQASACLAIALACLFAGLMARFFDAPVRRWLTGRFVGETRSRLSESQALD